MLLIFYIFITFWSNKTARFYLASLAFGAGVGGLFFYFGGVRLNTTPSFPRGLYKLAEAQDSPELIRRGDLAGFCLAETNLYAALARRRGYVGSGPCPSGLKPLLKQVAGLPGDVVEIQAGGLVINGRFWPGTARPIQDSLGRPLPPSLLRAGAIPEGFALLLSPGEGGFDGRHFGWTPLDALKKVTPLFIR